jgi:hypothetical protein
MATSEPGKNPIARPLVMTKTIMIADKNESFFLIFER